MSHADGGSLFPPYRYGDRSLQAVRKRLRLDLRPGKLRRAAQATIDAIAAAHQLAAADGPPPLLPPALRPRRWVRVPAAVGSMRGLMRWEAAMAPGERREDASYKKGTPALQAAHAADREARRARGRRAGGSGTKRTRGLGSGASNEEETAAADLALAAALRGRRHGSAAAAAAAMAASAAVAPGAPAPSPTLAVGDDDDDEEGEEEEEDEEDEDEERAGEEDEDDERGTRLAAS